mgnify:CR=1 FL=1
MVVIRLQEGLRTDMSRPLFVTGLPRSGTTFTSKILSQPSNVFNIGEPFLHRVGTSHLFPYYRTRNEAGVRYDELLRSILEYEKILQYRTKQFEWSVGGLRRFLLGSHGTLEYIRAWLNTKVREGDGHLLIKEPHGLLLTLPAVRKLDCRVLVMVRHPAGQVSSCLSLSWTRRHDRPVSLLDQPRLVEDHLGWLPDLLDTTTRTVVEDLGLMWRALYDVFFDYLEALDDTDKVQVIRHEDLCLSPYHKFSNLYDWADLPWSSKVERKIDKLTNSENPSERSDATAPHQHDLHRDSASLPTIWTSRLQPRQIQDLQAITAPVSSRLYDDADWSP